MDEGVNLSLADVDDENTTKREAKEYHTESQTQNPPCNEPQIYSLTRIHTECVYIYGWFESMCEENDFVLPDKLNRKFASIYTIVTEALSPSAHQERSRLQDLGSRKLTYIQQNELHSKVRCAIVRLLRKENIIEVPNNIRKSIVNICEEVEKLTCRHQLAEVVRAAFENTNYDPRVLLPVRDNSSGIPFRPCELWASRDKTRRENPIEFINRVYCEVMDGYFTTADLKSYDRQLHRALYNWIRDHNNNKRPPFNVLNLPTKKEVNDRLVEEIESKRGRSPRTRAQVGLSNASQYRKRQETLEVS